MLLLFDIDGTLLEGTRQAVGKAMLAALREVHEIDVGMIRTQIDTDGRTDGEIARAILVAAGVASDRIDGLAERVRDSCCQTAARLLSDDLSGSVLPGVRELLDWVNPQQGMKLGLLTGNYESIARLKLARAGIGDAFAPGQGAFGSDAEDRALLPGIARLRAGTTSAPYPRRDTVVIGDTPRDIACARADGVRCVAVATGSFTSDELVGADDVARDAFDLRRVLADLRAARPTPLGRSESRSQQQAGSP